MKLKSRYLVLIVIVIIVLAVFIIIVFGNAFRDYYTISELWNSRENLSDSSVKVIGYAHPSKVKVTFEMCPEDNPCCSHASATLLLVNEKLLDQYSINQWLYPEDTIVIRGNQTVGCFGNNCELTCNPLKKGVLYIVSGLLSFDGRNMILDLESFSDVS